MDTESIRSSSSSTTSMDKAKASHDDRGGWGGKLDFILTCIGYAVGLGNIWRFPYLCYKSGGGAFFIPYCIFLILCGLPLFFMEVSYGQFSSLSPLAIWRICPIFKGVGIGMVMVSSIVCIYYNVVIAWTIYYLFMSFRATLPWSHCNNDWNSDHCMDTGKLLEAELAGNATKDAVSAAAFNVSSGVEGMVANATASVYSALTNTTAAVVEGVVKKTSASEEFWEKHVLELSPGIDSMGNLRWQLLITLAVSWLCVFLCLFKGVKILGKVMHFAAPFPYLVLLVLLIRGVTLPGAINGISFYIIPRWEKLLEFQVWGDAALQIFYSVGMAWGGIITMASYNKFNNNVYRDAMIVPLINCGTSIFAGFVIFSILGFMAHEANSSVDSIVTQGPGLTFVAYPEAVSKLPISPLWAVLFFLMLFVIGLDSQFGMFETMLSGLIDEFPEKLRHRKTLVTAGACFFEFLLGLPSICQGGIYVLQIMDWYCASFSLMLISLNECVAIAWVYGLDRFFKDIALMIGFEPHRIFWTAMWKYITPAAILFIWLFSVVTLGPVTYGDYHYPEWAIAMGWSIGVCSIIPIPAYAIYKVCSTEGPLFQRIRFLMKPSPEWGPRLAEDRKRYYACRGIEDPDAIVALTEKPSTSPSPIYKPSSIEQSTLPKSQV
ncbi:sodium- and chloride-dependent glycine transporter 1-like [Babylonia areolata]|uniref:sodium- and chloride-dependent glycine transporter 1-like n=1 Tax=Babylonia areolata TaxID=304850 RepID=UPI003FD44E63